jgi:pimeloyl-ACP methyl ester carboxylesterase
VNTSVGQILVRKAGPAQGRPIVFIHASPASSRGLERLVAAYGQDRPAFTFDNPGNGDSAPIPMERPEIVDIAKVLCEAIDACGIGEFDLYGTHTGACIAMEIAIARPNQVKHAILDGITLMAQSKLDDYLANYLKPLQISSTGEHMVFAWHMLRDMSLFWPWYNRTAEGARGGLGTPEERHVQFLEFIKGGRTFHHQYRAAFLYKTRERLPLITVPVMVCAGPTDPLREGMEDIPSLNPSARVVYTPGGGAPEAAEQTQKIFRDFLAA